MIVTSFHQGTATKTVVVDDVELSATDADVLEFATLHAGESPYSLLGSRLDYHETGAITVHLFTD
jgi:hypothetical protein